MKFLAVRNKREQVHVSECISEENQIQVCKQNETESLLTVGVNLSVFVALIILSKAITRAAFVCVT